MNKLFWRFFLVFWATLLMAMTLVRLTFVWQDDGQWPPQPPSSRQHAEHLRDSKLPPPPLGTAAPILRRPLFHLSLVILASIIFSMLLARYIASPIRLLKQALAELADNRWQTQLGPELTSRKDEFGSVSVQFNQMAGKAAAAIASQQRLLHDVSHELRSPLARVQVLTGLATQSPADNAILINKIEQEVTKLDQLVNEILLYSRLESGETNIEHIDVNLSELLMSICDDAGLEAAASAKTLLLQPGLGAVVKGDPALLYSALENVIRNAVKFTPTHSEVNISLQQHDELIVIQVRDQGSGVQEQHLQRLFSPFFRAQSSFNGVGLGLSIAKRAIEACNGTIVAENLTDNGSVSGFMITITLPLPA